MDCETCVYYEYDDDDEAYYCSVSMDEDDYARMMQTGRAQRAECPFYLYDNEYEVVKHQM